MAEINGVTPWEWVVSPTTIHTSTGEVHEVYAPDSPSHHWIAWVLADAGSGADGKSNAHLIASAPDLLKALVDAAGALKATRESLASIGANIYPAFNEIVEHADAAIAKAGGAQ